MDTDDSPVVVDIPAADIRDHKSLAVGDSPAAVDSPAAADNPAADNLEGPAEDIADDAMVGTTAGSRVVPKADGTVAQGVADTVANNAVAGQTVEQNWQLVIPLDIQVCPPERH